MILNSKDKSTIKNALKNAEIRFENDDTKASVFHIENDQKIAYVFFEDEKSTICLGFDKTHSFETEVARLSIRYNGLNTYRIETFQVREAYRGLGIGFFLLEYMISVLKQQNATELIVYPNSATDYNDKHLLPSELYKIYHRQGFRFEDAMEKKYQEMIEAKEFSSRNIPMSRKIY